MRQNVESIVNGNRLSPPGNTVPGCGKESPPIGRAQVWEETLKRERVRTVLDSKADGKIV